MFVTNTTPYPHQLFFATDVAGTPHAVCILKASCPFDAPAWSRHHAEITYTDVPTDAARPSSIRLANDLAPYKPVADILLANAEAVSPKPKPAWGVSVRVGSHTTRVAVTGPRAWRRRVTGWVLDEPAHVSKVSVCFENAYGGTWSDGRCDDRNPVGTGFVPKGVDAQESIRAPQVLFDLALDYGTATRIAIAAADQAPPSATEAAAGLFQALGLSVSVVDDVPGLVALRTVAMLANFGADAVHVGIADAPGVDRAMQVGFNYPKGPLAWAQSLGLPFVVSVLDHLARTYGEDRYRASPLLRRHAASGARFFFSATDGASGSELWVSDGTANGTHIVADVVPGLGGSRPAWITDVGGVLFFAGFDAMGSPSIWRSYGSAAGTVQLKAFSPDPVSPKVTTPSRLIALGAKLFFVASDGVHGYEPWTSDGSPAGTQMLADVNPGAADGMSGNVTAFPKGSDLPAVASGRVYFAANDGIHGTELWSSDGSTAGTTMVADLAAGAAGSSPRWIQPFAAGVAFEASDSDGSAGKLFVSDGTGAGTAQVPLNGPSGPGQNPLGLQPAGAQLFFSARKLLLSS